MSQQNNKQKSQFVKKAEIIDVASDADGVMCDGGDGSLGHPQVWYGFDNGYHKDHVSCHYCGRKFVKTTAE